MCMLTFRERRMGVEKGKRKTRAKKGSPGRESRNSPSLPAGGASRLYYFEEDVL